MIGKNNHYLKDTKDGTKVESYSIKKFKVGTASVVIGASIFLGAGAVAQASEEVSNNTTADNTTNAGVKENVATTPVAVAQPVAKETTKEDVAAAVAAKLGGETAKEVKALDKTKLENYIAEIEAKIAEGKYESKTEESVAVLKADLEAAKVTLANATTQDEITKAYSKLVTTANTKLKNKPVEKKETPEVDTTNGQPTVGKKAENTEKKSDSNSIENTGSNDPRNGKALDRNNAFRAETTETQDNFTYSMEYSNGKEIYLYNEEDANVNITVNSTAGKIKRATVKGGSGQFLLKSKSDQAIAFTKFKRGSMPPEEEVEIDGFGWSYHQTLTETQGPVNIKITGKPNDAFKALSAYTKTENQHAVLGARYLELEDSTGTKMPGGSKPSAPGYFNLVVKSQTYKYDIQPVAEGNKVGVADINNLTPTDINKIKEKIKIQYSDTATTQDARLASKKGEVLADRSTVVKEITVTNGTVTVTYNDESVDTTPVVSVARVNAAPTVEIPFSVDGKKDIYVYANEDIDVDLKYNDDSGKIKSATIKQGGNRALPPVNSAEPNVIDNEFGTTFTQIDGETATPAIVKITGKMTKETPGLTASKFPTDEKGEYRIVTRYATATDLDDAIIDNTAIGNSYATDPGAFTLVLKSQSRKYDVKTPTEADKVSVANPSAVTDEEFEKIKEKVKLEYSTTNPDKNLLDKRGQSVDNQETKIQSITKNANNELVVTYSDGSIDKKPLSEFTTLNKQPAIDAVNTAATEKIAAINATPNATDEEKAAAIAKVNADKEKALTAINDATAKDALDKAKESGTTAIAADNPVVAKKAEAKKAIDDALTAKNNAIDARTDLTPEEKTKAKEIAKAKADAAKDAVDKATTNAEVDTAKTAGTTAVANVTPVAKEEAKKAIAKALEDKNAEIDKRTDLTDEEKTAAKNEAKDKADAQLAEIAKQPDAADTPEAAKTAQDAVDAAKKTGVDEVTAVNPVAVKKTEAKKAIDDALTAKNNAIDARTDLTDAEKKAAKDKAAEEAKKAKDAIDAATTDAAVDTAKTSGLGEVAKVNPVAKEAAKKAVADELAKKEAEIDARTDLTDAEKTKAKKDAQDKAKAATDAINAQPDNADTPEKATEAQTAVNNAKDKGVADVKAVNPVAKEAAKKAVADELAKKEAEIDARTDLTQEEKDVAKKDAQDKAKAATDTINTQPDNADTPEKSQEAQKAVDTAKKTGVDEVASVNPEAVTKPAAKKAIEDKLAKQLEEIANTPDATDEEKKVAADAAKALAEEAKKEIDKAGTDAEVNKLQEEAEKEIEKAVPVVEDKPNARKAIEDEAKAKKEAIDARTDLTPKAKEDLKAQVDKIADQAKKAVDKATSATDVDKIEEADKAAIKAVGEVNTPIEKTLVKDPDNLTADEKAKILEEVKKVNPTAKEVKYDEDGNIQVTTADGRTGTIDPTDLVKTADELDNGKGGNDINKPIDKVIVKDPVNLTDEEKAKIVDKVKAVNPDAVVTIDENGTVTVSTPEGNTASIPASELVRTAEDTAKSDAGNGEIVKPADKVVGEATDPVAQAKVEEKLKELNPEAKSIKFDEKGNVTVTLNDGTTATIPAEDLFKTEADAAKPNAGNDIVKPADKTAVTNPEKLTDAEKKAIEDKVKAVNPGATVVVDDKGNAIVTTPEGKTAVIPATDLVKSAADAAKPNAGNDIVKPADKTVVANPEKLTDAEKKAIEDKVKAVNPGATVVVDDKGNATVTTPEGKTAVIPATDLVKTPEDATKPNAGNDIVKPADKTVVANPEKLTDAEKKAIEDKVKAVNPGATVVVDDKGNATVATPEGKTAVIPATDLVKSAEDAAKPNAGNDINTPADKTAVTNPEKLTDAEKKAIEDKVKAVNPGATVVVDDKGNATVTTAEGKTAVIPATDLVKTFADSTENGKDNVNIPADKTVVANPEKLTDAEKKAIEDKVKAVNLGATVVVDDKGNATVTTPEGEAVVISATDLVKTSDDTTKPNAGNDVVKPANKVLVKDPAKLTDLEKKAIENSVVAVNPGAYVTVDDEGNVVVTTREGKTAVIPVSEVTRTEADATKPNAGNDVNTPSAKTVVANPEKLTDAEKKAIEDKVKAVNPGATVVVDDKGNATVITPEGKTAVIPAKDLVKKAEDTTKENAGNDANTPAAKTVVANPEKLTDAEKKEIAAKVAAVNPGVTVVVDDKGNATVVKGDGTVLEIPALDLVIPAEKLADEATNAKVKTPVVRTLVVDKEKLTDAEKEAVKKAIEAVNPGATVVVDDKGNATVTMPDGSTATISKEQLVKDKEDAKAKNGGDNLDFDLSKVEVTDLANITPEEKAKFQFMILGAIMNTNEFDRGAFLKETDAQGNTVYKSKNSNLIITIDKDGNMKVMKDSKTDLVVNIDEKGNVTIVTKEGKVLAIPRDDAFKQLPSAPQYDGNTGNTDTNVDKSKLESGIQNLERLIASELDKLDATKAKEAKALLAEAKKVFAKADATQAEVDAMVKRLEEFKLSQASGTNADASGSNAQGVNAKLGQRLANTGTTETNTGLAGLGLGILGTLLAATRRRKEK